MLNAYGSVVNDEGEVTTFIYLPVIKDMLYFCERETFQLCTQPNDKPQ
jgi:hypothetical protein